AQRAIDEKTVDHGVEADRKIDVAADEIIRHPAAKPVAAAFAVETQQMVAVKGGFTDPQFADHTAVDQGVVQGHVSWLNVAKHPPVCSLPDQHSRLARIAAFAKGNAALQQEGDKSSRQSVARVK